MFGRWKGEFGCICVCFVGWFGFGGALQGQEFDVRVYSLQEPIIGSEVAIILYVHRIAQLIVKVGPKS